MRTTSGVGWRDGWWVGPALLCLVPAAGQERDGWLNVRDFGASGSEFQTTAATTADSAVITVEDPGDFAVGQGVMLSRCNPQIVDDRLWGPGTTYGKKSGTRLADIIDIRGYDDSAGTWTPYVLDIEPVDPPNFRWSDDMGRTWHDKVPITFDWQPLHGGLEVRFHEYPWAEGYTATFSARDQLLSTIEAIEGKQLTLKDPATRAVTDAVLRHRDDQAIQAAVDQALKTRQNVYLPVGRYRLAVGLQVQAPQGLTIEGHDGESSVLDISEGKGCCLLMRGGAEATVRRLRMVGNMGFAERDQCGHFATWGSRGIWGQDLKTSFATGVVGTERVLVEDVHAYRMSLEAFWSGGPSRAGLTEPAQYTRAITYLRCWAIDCGRNGFNNNDLAENTSILNCRIVDVGGCAWEGASRFVKVVGNYIRNAGTVAIGNISSRDENKEILGSAQHVVADNVFESVTPYGGCAIRSALGATQVCITNNQFVNFGSSCIEVWGRGDPTHLPSANTTITGNQFDMTEVGDESKPRTCINIAGAEDTIIADNQMYVRGTCDPQVTGLKLQEPAINLIVHDNLMRNLGVGLMAAPCFSPVAEVVDEQTFTAAPGQVPLPRRRSARYAGWSLAWTHAGKLNGPVRIDSFDPETLQFHLAEPAALEPRDTFEVWAPQANWNVHDNVITGCLSPVDLELWGSPTTLFRDNLIVRGETSGVKQALRLRGRAELEGNRFVGFDEADSCAVLLQPDRFGNAVAGQLIDNRFESCTKDVEGGAQP